MAEHERVRLVTLGGPCVGKSSIVKRLLFNSFSEKYKPTVEDLYNQEYNCGGGMPLKVDILDTAGDLQFPAMRRLSMATAHAFLLVYSVDSRDSFESVKQCFEEIREQRPDFQDIPIIIAGNKRDVGLNKREVEFDEVCDWIHDHLPKLRGKAMECSAKENVNVREIFRTFLTLSKIPGRGEESLGCGGGGGLKRRSSAYAGSKSSAANRSASSTITSLGGPPTPPLQQASSAPSDSPGGRQGFSAFLSSAKVVLGSPTTSTDKQFPPEEGGGLSRFKGRSRSLIRRSSRKSKQQVCDASGGGGPQECQVS